VLRVGDPLPPWSVRRWFNADAPLEPAALRGRVVAIEVFQMLCPGCVLGSLPQALRLAAGGEVAVIGLHSVFEHHEAMGEEALSAFLAEFRIGFPVAIDQPSPAGPIPRTMQAWGLKGTPTLILLDRLGRVRLHHFGRIDDLALGLLVGRLLGEPWPTDHDGEFLRG
jgi:hypothetical protein